MIVLRIVLFTNLRAYHFVIAFRTHHIRFTVFGVAHINVFGFQQWSRGRGAAVGGYVLGIKRDVDVEGRDTSIRRKTRSENGVLDYISRDQCSHLKRKTGQTVGRYIFRAASWFEASESTV